MGSLCRGRDDVRAKAGTDNVPTNHHGIFEEFIPAFMQVFLDNFAVYSKKGEHLDHLWLCLERCRGYRLSLNPTKCIFGVTNGMLLGHIVSKDGIAVDPDKVKAILEAPAPMTAKALSRFLGQIRWHNQMLRYLADLPTPLHAAVHRTPFRWTELEDKVPCAQSNVVPGTSGTTPRLVKGISCLCGHI